MKFLGICAYCDGTGLGEQLLAVQRAPVLLLQPALASMGGG